MTRSAAVVAIVVAALAAATWLPRAAAAPSHPRIVSLIPSLTEDLFAIGAGPQVVAVSQFTDYPPAALRLPRVASFAAVDAEAILRLHPDAVVGIEAQRGLVADLRHAGLDPTLLRDDSFDDIFADLRVLGTLSGHASEAAALGARLRRETRALVRSVPAARAPSVFVVLGTSPIYTVGNGSYIAHLVALAGGRNAADDLHAPYGRYSEEALLARQPDVIVADRESRVADALGRAPWTSLRAVREHRLYVLDDADLLERPGPRYNEGLRWLIARLHGRAGA